MGLISINRSDTVHRFLHGSILAQPNDTIYVPISEDNVGIITRTHYGYLYSDYYSTRFNEHGWNMVLNLAELKQILIRRLTRP